MSDNPIQLPNCNFYQEDTPDRYTGEEDMIVTLIKEDKMKAKMKTNLVERYIALAPDVIDYPDDETIKFLKSIEDKEVELVFVCQDAFEINDKNYWLPDCLWDELNS